LSRFRANYHVCDIRYYNRDNDSVDNRKPLLRQLRGGFQILFFFERKPSFFAESIRFLSFYQKCQKIPQTSCFDYVKAPPNSKLKAELFVERFYRESRFVNATQNITEDFSCNQFLISL